MPLPAAHVHVWYLLLFGRHGPYGHDGMPRARTALLAGAYGTALVVTVALLWPGLPAGLRVPVAGYSLLLTAMAFGALRFGPVAAVGGGLFLLSDALIATDAAGWPQRPRPGLWATLAYPAAQYLLARGTLRALAFTSGSAPAVPSAAPKRRRPAPAPPPPRARERRR